MMTYFVFFVTVACLPLTALSFSFTRKPEQPMTVVLNSNSTNVDFRWDFSLASGDRFSYINLYRYEKDKGPDSRITLGFYQADYTDVNTTLYSLSTNVTSGPSSAYFRFTIKDITKQINNKDGSKADPRPIEYIYRLEMKMANIRDPEVSDVEMRVLLRVHSFKGPKNTSVNELEEFEVTCSADGKPSPTLTVSFPNVKKIYGSGTLKHNVTAYRNMTGMYNCTAENEVTAPQTERAWLNVWFTPDDTRFINLPSFVCLNHSISLTCKANGYPSNITYTFKRGSHNLGSISHGSLQILGSNAGVMDLSCTPSNTAGTGQVATKQVLVMGLLDKTKTCKINNETITNKTVVEGSQVDLRLTSSEMERLNFTWKNKKVEISGEVGNNLIRKSITRYQGGLYQVVARDRFNCSVNMECYFTLNVQFPSSCKIYPDAITVNETENVSLNVITTGNPPVYEYIWTHPNGSRPNGITDKWTFPASRQDNGIYKVSVYNGVGAWSNCTSNVTVRFPSSCKIKPDPATVKENERISLNVTTKGNPPVYEYIWTHPNGSRLTWDTDRRTFTASRQDAGTYNLSVYNGVGGRSYCTRHVTVKYKPEQTRVWFSPNKTTVNEGEDINMTCKAEAIPKPYYLWIFKGKILQSKINDTISLSNITSNDAGEYTCSAVNYLGRSTATKTLMVNYIRKPTCEAVPVIVKVGASITLNCSVDAYPLASYSWNLGEITEPTSTVILTASPDLDKKSFTCTATNSRESKNCSTTPLDVRYRPRDVRILAQYLMVKESNVINLTCIASSNPASSYTWSLNGRLMEGANSSLLIKYNVSRSDAGEYNCTASNELGTAYNITTVNVMHSPELKCKEKLVVIKGQERNFSCNASAFPLPTYTVRYKHVIYPSRTLLIKFNRNDNGSIITCNASNSLGSEECETVLIVTYKPEQTRVWFSPNKSTVNEGEDINMTCKAEANPQPYYLWIFKGQMLQSRINDTINLSNITANDAGEYTCSAVNDVGRSTATKTLMVNYFRKPTCEAVPVIVKVGANITLNCSVDAYPPASYSWNLGEITEPTSTVILTASLDLDKKSFTCTATNSRESKNCSTTPLEVLYFDENICKILKHELVTVNGTRNFTDNITGFGNPYPNLTCWSAQDQVKSVVSWKLANSKYTISINMTSESNVSCMFFNNIGSCFKNFTIRKKKDVPSKEESQVELYGIPFSSLKDNTIRNNLKSKIETEFVEVYRRLGKEYLINISVIDFVEGSVWVNFELELIANVPNPLQPLQDALVQNKGNIGGLMFNERSLNRGFFQLKTTSTATPTTTPIAITSEKTIKSPPFDPTITIIVIIVVAVLIVLIVLIWWCCKNKRANRENSALVINNTAVEVMIMTGTNNDGYATSQYAEHGPSDIDPAYDSVDGVRKDAKDKNDNQTQSERETEEPAYAAVDKTKKPKKNNPGELLYADLGDFKKNGDKAPGGRGGIVLEPLPKGQDAKMPDKYEETIYAEIVGTKKPASDNQNAEGTSTDVPLDELHGQANETEKPSGESADPSKPNDQKPATGENENPTDVQSVKPLAKEDSEKAFSQTHPADSLHKMNGRNDTTLTTVSL